MKKLFEFSLILFTLFLISCGKKIQIKTAADLENKTVGCQAGTTGETFLLDNYNSIAVKTFRTASEACLSLKNKSLDAVIIDEYPARKIVSDNNDLEIIDLNFPAEEYAIAVAKGNKVLLDSINSTIQKLKSTKTYDILINSFIPADGNIVIPEIEILKTKETVKMGTNASFPPFEYTNGTEVVGFDASFAKYIANDYGKRLQIIDMSFSSLIDALNSGTIDFIAAGMSVSPARKKLVDFSEPYFSSKQVIIVRK